MILPITKHDGFENWLDLQMDGCVVIEGRRYIEFTLYSDSDRVKSRVPMDILMRWETLRDKAFMKAVGDVL